MSLMNVLLDAYGAQLRVGFQLHHPILQARLTGCPSTLLQFMGVSSEYPAEFRLLYTELIALWRAAGSSVKAAPDALVRLCTCVCGHESYRRVHLNIGSA